MDPSLDVAAADLPAAVGRAHDGEPGHARGGARRAAGVRASRGRGLLGEQAEPVEQVVDPVARHRRDHRDRAGPGGRVTGGSSTRSAFVPDHDGGRAASSGS